MALGLGERSGATSIKTVMESRVLGGINQGGCGEKRAPGRGWYLRTSDQGGKDRAKWDSGVVGGLIAASDTPER